MQRIPAKCRKIIWPVVEGSCPLGLIFSSILGGILNQCCGMNFPQNLYKKLEKRRQENALRRLPKQGDKVDFSSNDYLGFAQSLSIHNGTIKLLAEQLEVKNGSTGSRLLSGNHALYEAAELQLAQFHNAPAALVYNSGYTANLGLLGALLQRGDTIFYDEYIHASLRDGIQAANAKAFKFKHNDLEDLTSKLERIVKTETTNYIVTESIFSMDGDQPDLVALVALAQKYNAYIIIDEAHATGVFGPSGAGLVQQLGLEWAIFARIHTFGKALGCHGAVVLGSQELIDFLVNFSRPLIYSTALAPHALANIVVAYQALKSTATIEQLRGRIDFFKKQVIENGLMPHFIGSDSAIQCCVIPGNDRVKKASQVLFDQGFDIKPVLSPTVPEGKERLRFCLHSYNELEDISTALQVLANILQN